MISLIGESGSGKSTIGRMILRLLTPTSGTIRLDGIDVAGLGRRDLKQYYSRVQGVFQDPFSSFNPIFKVDRVFTMLRDAYFAHADHDEWHDKVVESLTSVDLDAAEILGKYPHQLSGGQLQRLLVARALMLEIRYLVADEISSMLDASTRIDVLNLLADLRERGLGVLFITHDLSLGNYISSRTIILQRGEIVEMGPTATVYDAPPLIVTENGVACADELEDDERIAFLKAHLERVFRASGDGVPVLGYFVWSLLDNFEWTEGYAKRFGLVRVDYETLERTPRRSFEWYRDLIYSLRAPDHFSRRRGTDSSSIRV